MMHTNREAWLLAAVTGLKPMFDAAGLKVPAKLRVACGFPGHGSRKKRIGECWNEAKQVFISPTLDDESRVLDVLCHELIHACLPPDEKHGPAFKQGMKAVGLEGKATATVASAELVEKIKPIVKKLGPYPHKALDLGSSPEKKQTTRLRKVECECGLIVRVTQKWIDEGEPKCWLCGSVMEVS